MGRLDLARASIRLLPKHDRRISLKCPRQVRFNETIPAEGAERGSQIRAGTALGDAMTGDNT